MWKRSVGWILVLVAGLAGCPKRPEPLPKSYSVHGKVTYEDGKPVTAGVVTFIPSADPTISSRGRIGKDGTYQLATMRSGLRADGGVPGPNRVMVRAGKDVNNYSTPYTVSPGDNEINLTLTRMLPTANQIEGIPLPRPPH